LGEIEPIPVVIVLEKPSSPVEIPKEVPESQPEEKEEAEATLERSLESSRVKNKGKRKITEDFKLSQGKRSASKRGQTHKLSMSKSRFTPLIDPELTETFFEKWSSRPIGVGRYFDFEKLQDAEIFVKQYPDALGWVPFLQIKEKYYP